MMPISEFDPNVNTGRILVFTPTYPAGHEMRLRILDANFVRFAGEITHFIPLEELEPEEESIYEAHGYADRDDYLTALAEEHDVDLDAVVMLASVLGEAEDFDGLVSMIADRCFE